MVVKKIVKLCKDRGKMNVYKLGNMQWIGIGAALYLLPDLPDMTPAVIAELYGINQAALNKMETGSYDSPDKLPPEIINDSFSGDEHITRIMDYFWMEARLRVFDTGWGVRFLDVDLLRPFDDEPGIEIMFRKTPAGEYFIVKDGLYLVGVIMPCVCDDFEKAINDAVNALRNNYRRETE